MQDNHCANQNAVDDRSFQLKKNFSTLSRLEPLQGGSLLFSAKLPEIPGTHFTDLGRMKG